ncbi:MAG: hypothetical protein EON54_20005 [Alcaligenaceae bacterium]|nr:MAG: hypothetical protein EON54_20005 [Alcaligenaceae bacterium]
MPLLDDYIAQLATIQNPADLNAPHADWIWHRRNDVTDAVARLNQELGFAGAGQFQPHMLTTSVGDASGLLFVSANPGWRRIPNTMEDAFRRSSLEANREFCSDFFTVFRREVGGNGWWSRALLLAHLVQFGAPAPGQPMVVPQQRWAWAQAGGAASGVGNVDLIPFHSIRDEFGTLQGANLNPARLSLLNVATATLHMVLHLQPAPKLTFVGSALGAPLTNALCAELNMVWRDTPDEDVSDPLWSQLHRWVHPETGAKVMNFPYEVMAGFASVNLPQGFMVPLAARLRAFIEEPVG